MRVKGGNVTRKRHKKWLKQAEGYRGSLSKLYRPAKEAVMKALCYSYKHRRTKKRDFRSLWIVRINAACRQANIPYGQFMNGLRKANIIINRKILAEFAANEPTMFESLVNKAKACLAS